MSIKLCSSLCALLSLLLVTLVVDGALVSEGPSGLVYTPYANEGQSNVVNTVPDFSRAGYGGGGVAIPFVSAAVTIDDGPGDDTALIQGAIDQLSSLPMGPDGFRGALLIRAGDYTVSSTLEINASGVVIRGEGQQEAGGTRITYTATNESDLFHVHGNSGPSTVGGSMRSIVDTYVPVGARTLSLDDTSPFAPGDLIRLTNTVNQAWIEAIGMDAVSPAWTPAEFELEFFRYIESVDGNQITLDAPIIQAVEAQYGGGTLERLSFNGALENVGIENIRLESTFISDTDEDHGWEAIEMKRVRNGWVRQVTGRYFGKGLILIEDSSQFVTVEDCAFLDPKSQTTGARKYSFYVDDASYVLVQRCFTRGGRHDYVSGSKTSGPNVFVDSLATQASNDIGPHFRYATGELYDNIKSNNDINVQNRFNSGTSHGWSGAQVMFWNVEANNVRSDAPTGAMNWSIGTVGNKADGNFGSASAAEPFGIWESEGVPVQPRSLYYAQLAERLGGNALLDVRLPQQEPGRIWAELENWAGDGLLLDPVIALLDQSATVGLNDPVAIRGRIRDLGLMDNLASVTWSQVSGPGTTTFTDSSAIETTVSFTASGQYRLQLLADDGSRQISGQLVVQVIDQNDTIAPAAPTGLTLTPSHNRVNLDWADNGEADLGGYAVYRREASGSFDLPLATGIGQSHYQDDSATNGSTYYYVVRAQDVNGNQSQQSGEESATPFDNDPPPDLSFNEPADGTAFLLGESFAVQVAASDRDGSIANVKLYLDGQLIRQENGAPYDWSSGADAALRDLPVGSYTLEAVAEDDDGQTTTLAITLLIEPDTEAPMAPTGVEATAGNGAIFLQWAANSEPDLASYAIYRSEVADADGAPIFTGVTANGFTDVTVTNGTRYYYKVAAVDSSSNGSLLSAEVDATPRSMLDFGTDAGKLTVESAGFTPTIHASGSALHINDAYQMTSGPVGHENFAFLKSFPGMAAADRNDFAITLEARLASKGPATANYYRYGIALFADSNDLEGAGLTAQLLYDNDTLRILLREGLNGATLAEEVFQTVGGSGRPYDYPEGESYTFEINGIHGTGDQLDLFFTLSGGNLSESIQFTVDRSQYPGELFGGAARIRDEFAVDFDNFELSVDGMDPDSDADGMADDWEALYFGPLDTVDGSGDADGDGTLDFFEYLLGTNPTDPGETGNVRVGPNPNTDGQVFEWSVRPGMEVGTDYQIHFSTSLAAWASLPTEHYTLEAIDSGGRTHLELDLAHDYGSRFFLKLVRP
jgi:fibronectin type 3 domain-containing protein